MKRILLILLSLLLVASPAPARAESSASSGGLNAVCVDGDNVYVLQGGELWAADDALNRQTLLCAFEEDICALSVYDGQFYFAWESDGRLRFARTNAYGNREELFDVPAERALARLVATDELLVALWRYTPEEVEQRDLSGAYAVTAYDLYGEPVYLPLDSVRDVARSRRYGLIYTVPTNVGRDAFRALNPLTGERHLLNADGIPGCIAESPDGAAIYFDQFNVAYRLQPWPSAAETVGLIETPAGALSRERALVCTGSRLISYCPRGDMDVQSWPLDGDPENRARLVLANCSDLAATPLYRAARERFERLHPEVELVFRELEPEQLRAALLSGDGSVDLLLVSSQELADLVGSGALYDLNGDETLSRRLAHWTGSRALCWQGVRYGVPLEVDALAIRENAALAPYAPRIDWQRVSWLEFFQLADQFQTDLNRDGRQDVWLYAENCRFPYWLSQYMCAFDSPAEVRFDTDTFRALARAYRRCAQTGAILDVSDGSGDPELALYAADCVFGPNARAFLPLPTIDGRRAVPAVTFALGVSSGSAHRDWAIDFLRVYTDDAVQATENGGAVGLAPDSVLYPGFAELTDAERYTVEAQKAYLDVAVPEWYHMEYALFSGDQMQRYLAGEIQLDELIQTLQQKLDMVLLG